MALCAAWASEVRSLETMQGGLMTHLRIKGLVSAAPSWCGERSQFGVLEEGEIRSGDRHGARDAVTHEHCAAAITAQFLDGGGEGQSVSAAIHQQIPADPSPRMRLLLPFISTLPSPSRGRSRCCSRTIALPGHSARLCRGSLWLHRTFSFLKGRSTGIITPEVRGGASDCRRRCWNSRFSIWTRA